MRIPALAISALLTLGASTLPSQTPPPAHTNPRDARIAAVIPYSEPVPGHPLTMDFYAPSGPAPHPAVLIIHGGGFVEGTSRNGSEAYAADFLAPAGYAVFSINYRLHPAAQLSDMVADTQRAVRFVRHNAAKYQVDPNKIALLGGSAGGYLSNMVGVLRPSADPQVSDAVDRESDAVQAVVTLFGISDLTTMPDHNHPDLASFVGPAANTDAHTAMLDASPIRHVAAGAPPFLLIHGDHDQSVPIAQSTTFQGELRKAGVRADLITIPNGPHATGSWYRIPGVPDWERQTVDWLNEVLHHTGAAGPGILARQPDSGSGH